MSNHDHNPSLLTHEGEGTDATDTTYEDHELAEVRAALDEAGVADRAEIGDLALARIAEHAVAASLAPPVEAPISLPFRQPERSAFAWRIAAAAALFAGVGCAWFLSQGTNANRPLDANAMLAAGATAGPSSASPSEDEIDEFVQLASALDDGTGAEIDSLFLDTEKLESNLKSDWSEGGAL